jgi:hypothetical protein
VILKIRVNWFCAIINITFLNNDITIQPTASVPLQFSTCLKNSIMYAKHRIGPTCRCIGLKKERDMFFALFFNLGLLSSSQQTQRPPPSTTATYRCPNSPRQRTREEELARGGARTRGRARPRARLTLRRTWPPHPPGAAYGKVESGNTTGQIRDLRCATFKSSPPGIFTPRRLHPPPLLVAIHGPYRWKSKIPGRQPAADPSSFAVV